jgi:hypothetical protein
MHKANKGFIILQDIQIVQEYYTDSLSMIYYFMNFTKVLTFLKLSCETTDIIFDSTSNINTK